MKKFAAFISIILILLCLCACGGKNEATEPAATDALSTEPTVETKPQAPITIPDTTEPAKGNTDSEVFKFPKGTSICGADVSGMTQEDAYAAISTALNAYTLNLRVNGRSVAITGSQIGLNCPKAAFAELMDAVKTGADPSDIDLLAYDSAALRDKLSASLNISAKNASIYYDSGADSFRLSKDSAGRSVNIDTVMAEADPVILSLGTSLSVTASEEEEEPSIKADSDTAKKALSKANAFLDVKLTYTYTPDNKPTQKESISKDTIGSLISFNNDLSSFVSSTALRKYVNGMSTKYSVKGDAGQFKTSGGYYINLTVDYAGQPVDTDGLYDDIRYCLENGISGTRTAPYLDVIECEDLAFDGNYVEVNLSAQYLWVYRNGNCVVSTPIVSGCAYYHNTTPTGVYSIYAKSTGVYLVGETWNSYVNYWMPFKGGYGLHDASWRSEFGGDIYLYDGSHGCVNLPSGVAGNVFNNVFVGTKVILYGGATSAEPVQQNIVGTMEYEVPLGTKPFKLDAQPEYGEDKTLTYSSNKPDVVEVAEDGTVTIKGIGKATITVTAAKREYYTSAKAKITIQVTDPCKESGHTFGKWKTTTAATCTAEGEQTRTCKVCKATETKAIPAAHTYGKWKETLKATCTTEGKQVRSCSICGEAEEEIIPAAGHSFSQWSENPKATCTTEGKQTRTCSACNTTEEEILPATGHSFGQWITTTEATCTTDGSQTRTCSGCGNTETQTIPAGHKFSDWTVTTEPGCESEGTKTRTCSVCNETQSQQISSTGHNFGNGQFCGNGCGAENPNYQAPGGSSEPTVPDGFRLTAATKRFWPKALRHSVYSLLK